MKVTLGGEQFDFDITRQPMSEALLIEDVWDHRYAEFETELAAGSAQAFCILAWKIWHRDGRDVSLRDVLDGKVDFDLMELVGSIQAAVEEAEKTTPDPTITAGSAGPAGTHTTPPGTPGRSRKSST